MARPSIGVSGSMSRFSLGGLSIDVDQPKAPIGFGRITRDNLSIGPDGLLVDGVRTSSLFATLADLMDTNELLGTGVSGSVKKAKYRATGKVYAVKTMHLENSDEFLQKRLVELKTLMASDHPNIVGFYGAFYNDGVLSFVLEYMDRGTLADLLARVRQIPMPSLGRLTHDLLQGLHYIHKRLHLIHRDLKPQNILLNGEGQIKITDFGVSGELSHTASFAKTFVGTIKYMSPARLQGEKHSAKSDVWSFGIVVLECALGAHPYGPDDGKTFFSRLTEIAHKPAPRADPTQFPPEFCSFIETCLQKEEAKLPEAGALLEHAWILRYKLDSVATWLVAHVSKK